MQNTPEAGEINSKIVYIWIYYLCIPHVSYPIPEIHFEHQQQRNSVKCFILECPLHPPPITSLPRSGVGTKLTVGERRAGAKEEALLNNLKGRGFNFCYALRTQGEDSPCGGMHARRFLYPVQELRMCPNHSLRS